jgi:hypothetical protein
MWRATSSSGFSQYPEQGQVGVGYDNGWHRSIDSWATWYCPESILEEIDVLYCVSLDFKFRRIVNYPIINILLGKGPSWEYGYDYTVGTLMSGFGLSGTSSKDIKDIFYNWMNGSTYGRSNNMFSLYLSVYNLDQYSLAFWDIESFNITIEYKPINNERTVTYTTTLSSLTNINQSSDTFHYWSYDSTDIVAGTYEYDDEYDRLYTTFGITFPASVLNSIKVLNKATLKVYFSYRASDFVYLATNSVYISIDENYIILNPYIYTGWYSADMTKIFALWLIRRGTATEHRFRWSIHDWHEGFAKLKGAHDTLYARIELEYVPHNYFPDTPVSLSPNSVSNVFVSDTFGFYYSDYDGDPMTKCRIRYRIQGESEWTESDEIITSVTGNSYATFTFPRENFLHSTIYEWQAAAYDGEFWSDWSETAVFLTNSPPDPPENLSPDTISTTLNATIPNDFSFEYFDPNEHSMTQFQVRYKITGEEEWTTMPVVQKLSASGVSCSFTIPSNTLEAGQLYEWQVRVCDVYLWSDWSESAYFKTNTRPNKPIMLNPNTDETAIDPTIYYDLSFLYTDNDSQDMTKCQIRYRILQTDIWTEGLVAEIFCPDNSIVTYTLPGGTLTGDSTYEWQARTFDGQAWSLWSDSAILRTSSGGTHRTLPYCFIRKARQKA